jgi:hypothetical protein
VAGRNRSGNGIVGEGERQNLPISWCTGTGRAIRLTILPRGDFVLQFSSPSNVGPRSTAKRFGFRVAFDHLAREPGAQGGCYLIGADHGTFTAFGEQNGCSSLLSLGLKIAVRNMKDLDTTQPEGEWGGRRGPKFRVIVELSLKRFPPMNSADVLFGSRGRDGCVRL